MVELKGVVPALTTPFKEDRSIDLPAFRTLVDILIEDGVDSLLVGGCTGEAWALDDDERATLFKTAVDQAAGRVPTIAGCGDMLTEKAIFKVRQAEAAGVDVVMLQPPWYVLPQEEDLLAYFLETIQATQLPVMIYNIPRRTNVNLSLSLIDRLADEPNVIAIKESSNDWHVLSAIIRRFSDRISVLAGFVHQQALAAFAEGAVGYCDSATPVWGRRSVEFYQAAISGNLERARQLQSAFGQLNPRFREAGTFPAGIKTALDLIGRPGGWPRDPVKPVTPEKREMIRAALVDVGLLGAGEEVQAAE